MLQDIVVDALLRLPGVVARVAASADAPLGEAIRRHSPDLLLAIEPDGEARAECERFVTGCAHRSSLQLSDDGRNILLTRLRPERLRIADVSLESLMQAIQGRSG